MRRLPVFTACLGLAALATLPAAAMIEPCSIDEMVAAADTVVQIDRITVGSAAGGDCMVSGRIAHVLAGKATVGDMLTVTVACYSDPEVMCGGTVQSRAALEQAEMIELYLTDGQIAGAGDGIDIIDAAHGGTPQHVNNCDG